MELILSTYGTSLTRSDDCLMVRNNESQQKFSVKEVSAVHISKGVHISSDAIMLAVKNEIPILFLEDSGKPCARIWSPKYGSISTIRKGQLAFCQSEQASVWIRRQLRLKIESQQAMLAMVSNYKPKEVVLRTTKAIRRMDNYLVKLNEMRNDELNSISGTLRGWEGAVAKIYFSEINNFLPEVLRFEERTQHPAKDIFNAFLNFGYGILYGKVEAALIKAGIDPYIGILHRDDYNKPALVFDVIEPFRVWIDYVVVNLLCQLDVTSDYYSVDKDGAVWLESLGRRTLVQSVFDFLEEPVKSGDEFKTRLTQIQDNANALAKTFSTFFSKKGGLKCG